jgi:choline dehydrogenase-like flavoprotein
MEEHDLANLYVANRSFFVSNGAVNPALMAVANARRVGDCLAEPLR